jgi:hypothetical protein
LGSKSARIAGEFLPIWAKRRSRDGSRPSCGVANVQLRQGFRLALCGLQIWALSSMLFISSLVAKTYMRAVRLFLAGLAIVALGIAAAILADIAGLGPKRPGWISAEGRQKRRRP